MKDILVALENLLESTRLSILTIDTKVLEHKESDKKWSKKEIIGHLIDSAINNLQRFCEVQFIPQPYEIRKYNQDQLVKVNSYQKLDIETLLLLWVCLNKQVIVVIKNMDDDVLNHTIKLNENMIKTVKWLVLDYIEHMEHHLKQILN